MKRIADCDIRIDPSGMDYVNPRAKLVIVGITPGESQMKASRDRKTAEEIKCENAFAGGMRKQLEAIKEVIQGLQSEDVQVVPSLYKINRKNGVVDASVFSLSLGDGYAEYLKTVLGNSISVLDDVDEVSEYKGEYVQHVLWWSDVKSQDVSRIWDALSNAKRMAEKEWLSKYKSLNCKGVILQFVCNGKNVDFIFNTPPFKQLKGVVFTLVGNKFKFTNDRILALPLEADAIRVDDRIYFLTERGVRMLESPEDLAKRSREVIDKILNLGIVSDPENFAKYAADVDNRRRLRKFEEDEADRLKLLADKTKGKKIREKFGLKIDGKQLTSTTKEDVDRVVKLVCQRGMLNPFDDAPMEVHSPSPWGGSNG